MYMKDNEIPRIIKFIREYVKENEEVVIPVSGGIDSDVVTRLCHKALGKDRIKIFIVKQNGIEEKFIKNARLLANDLNVRLIEIPIEDKSSELIKILEKADKDNVFHSNSLLDCGKANASLRAAIISCYQDKGYVIAGCTNRTEYELGFFMTFGDNLANFKPIEHLYKTKVIEMAKILGTRKEVIYQSPSAGFWENQEDLEDIAYWIVNKGPILRTRKFTDEEVKQANNIKQCLDWAKIDYCLKMIKENKEIKEITDSINLSEEIVNGINDIVKKAKQYKSREILKSLRE